MANEGRRHSTLSYKKGKIDWNEKPTSFTFNVDATNPKGPCPGAIEVTTEGTDVDLSELDTPGPCRIMNLDDTNFVTYGIWDVTNSIFFPLGELLPGEFVDLRLSRYVEEEFITGTGTEGVGNSLRIKADTADCDCYVGAFEA